MSNTDEFQLTIGSATTTPHRAFRTGSLHVDLTVSGAHTIDREAGEVHDLTLTGNATFTLAGADHANALGDATSLLLLLRQDGIGSRTVTWDPLISWEGGSAPTLQTAANALDVITLVTTDDGTTWLGIHVGGGGVSDHGALTGLADDDHPQYATDTDLTNHEATSHGRRVVMRVGITNPPEPTSNVNGDGWVYMEV